MNGNTAFLFFFGVPQTAMVDFISEIEKKWAYALKIASHLIKPKNKKNLYALWCWVHSMIVC